MVFLPKTPKTQCFSMVFYEKHEKHYVFSRFVDFVIKKTCFLTFIVENYENTMFFNVF